VIDVAGPQPEGTEEVKAQKANNFFAAMQALLAAGEEKVPPAK